jgi:hypothetical protein
VLLHHWVGLPVVFLGGIAALEVSYISQMVIPEDRTFGLPQNPVPRVLLPLPVQSDHVQEFKVMW